MHLKEAILLELSTTEIDHSLEKNLDPNLSKPMVTTSTRWSRKKLRRKIERSGGDNSNVGSSGGGKSPGVMKVSC